MSPMMNRQLATIRRETRTDTMTRIEEPAEQLDNLTHKYFISIWESFAISDGEDWHDGWLPDDSKAEIKEHLGADTYLAWATWVADNLNLTKQDTSKLFD